MSSQYLCRSPPDKIHSIHHDPSKIRMRAVYIYIDLIERKIICVVRLHSLFDIRLPFLIIQSCILHIVKLEGKKWKLPHLPTNRVTNNTVIMWLRWCFGLIVIVVYKCLHLVFRSLVYFGNHSYSHCLFVLCEHKWASLRIRIPTDLVSLAICPFVYDLLRVKVVLPFSLLRLIDCCDTSIIYFYGESSRISKFK